MGPSRRVSHLPFDPEWSYVSAYRRFFFEAFADRLVGRVLDLGAGGTAAAHTYRTLSGSIDEYVAVDRNRGPELDVVADGALLPFRDDAFDTVVLSSVVEHVPPSALFDLLSEVRRVLRSGGHALVHLPFLYPLHGTADYSRLTPQGLDDAFGTVGFDDIDVYRGGGYADVLLQTLYVPLTGVADHLGSPALKSAFAAVHYPVTAAAKIADRMICALYDENPASEPWHLQSFVVAR